MIIKPVPEVEQNLPPRVSRGADGVMTKRHGEPRTHRKDPPASLFRLQSPSRPRGKMPGSTLSLAPPRSIFSSSLALRLKSPGVFRQLLGNDLKVARAWTLKERFR